MKQNIISYINKLEGFKTAIKNLHWSSSNMSEHKLCDEIADTISDNQDEIAEISQGLFGQIKKKELKPISYTVESTKKMLNDLIVVTNSFYKGLDGDKFIGLRSVVEAFLGELNKNQYLIDLCLKEDIKKRIMGSKLMTENKQIDINENVLRSMIRESINRTFIKEGLMNYTDFSEDDESDYDSEYNDLIKEILKIGKTYGFEGEFDEYEDELALDDGWSVVIKIKIDDEPYISEFKYTSPSLDPNGLGSIERGTKFYKEIFNLLWNR